MPKSLSSHSTRSTTSRTARSESTMSADTVPSQGRSGSAASGSHFQRRVLRSSSSSSVNTVQRVGLEWTELAFPALNVLWPTDAARIADEALACATYHLWTLRPCSSDPKHKFCVAAQPFSSVNRKHTAAKTALTLPIQYSELARQFYSAWNVAIYAFRSDAVSIPREARDPEVHALRRVMRYLKAYLISLYSIHGAILDSPSDGPNALLSFAAYCYHDVGLDKPFPDHLEPWWKTTASKWPSVDIIFDWKEWSDNDEAHKCFLGLLAKYPNDAIKKADGVKYVDPKRIVCDFMGFYPHDDWLVASLYERWLQDALNDPLIDNEGQQYKAFMARMDAMEERGEINEYEILEQQRVVKGERGEVLRKLKYPDPVKSPWRGQWKQY